MPSADNKALARSNFEDLWNKRDLGKLEQNVAADYIHHEETFQGQETRGIEAWKQMMNMYLTVFPDLHFTIEDMVAEGDRVVVRWTARGTHKAELMGIPPTGKKVVVTGISIDRIAGGKTAETWENWDTLGLLRQLGAVQ